MPRQTLVFTALPNGPELTGRLQLSVFISPRLFPDGEVGTLADFPDLSPWPDTVGGITWSVLLDGLVVPATVVTPTLVNASAAWWTALLPSTTPVRGHTQPNYADRAVVSYSVDDVLGQLRGIWQEVLSKSPTVVPPNRELLGHVATAADWNPAELDRVLNELLDKPHAPEGPADAPPGDLDENPDDHEPDNRMFGPSPEKRAWRDSREREWIAGQRDAAEQYESYLAQSETHRKRVASVRRELDPEALLRPGLTALYAVKDFHQPRVTTPHDARYARPDLPDYDVHQLIAMLGSHPSLLRRLGLVVDLQLPVEAPYVGGAGVEVIADWVPKLPGEPQMITPRTLLDPAVFRARSDGAGGQVSQGFVRLRDPAGTRVTPIVADPDGASMQMVAATEGLIRRLVWRDDEQDETADGLPTMRSAGLSLALNGRGAKLQAAFVKAHTRNAEFKAAAPGAPADVDADDLTRGWRVDVQPTGDRWRSTMARDARYSVGDVPALAVSEEGVVTPTASGQGNALEKPTGALHVPESLFLWQGWSLVVPRPGTPITTTDQVAQPDPLQTPGPLGVEYQFGVVAGSLPALRFGRKYAFRLRAVDLAGNGPALDDEEPADGSGSIDPVPYLRFDPVAPPEVLPRSPRGPGDGPLRLVLRGDFEASPVPPTAERHVVPSRTSQLLAEQHGLFDVGGSPNPAAYGVIAPADGPSESGTYAEIPGAMRDPEFLGKQDADDPGAWYFDMDTVPMAYLPDPLAAGAAFRGLPDSADTVVVPFAPEEGRAWAWPWLRPFRIVLKEGFAAHTWIADARVLEVSLPRGAVCDVELSTSLAGPDLPLFGLRDWYLESGPADADRSAFDAAAVQGQVWGLTPPRRLRLVHAVKRPIEVPKLFGFVANRSSGVPYAELTGMITFSRPTTGGVDLVASWTEAVDLGQGNVDAAAGGPELVPDPVTAEPRSAVLPLSLDDHVGALDVLEVARRQDFGDGKHRSITYQAVATTAFLEYFTRSGEVTMPAALPADVVLDTDGVVPNTVVLTDPSGSAYRVRDAANHDGAFTVEEGGVLQFSDWADARRPVAGTVLRAVYNVPKVTQTSEPVTVEIPASVRPTPPKVLYALPTYAWSSDGPAGAGSGWSERRGNSLRVYLDRPWWSSGDGELLGVVVLEPGSAFNDDARQYVTSWGDDPVNPTNAQLAERPSLDNLPDAFRVASGLRLEELPYRRVDVAGFVPVFDAERKLWSCDIPLDLRSAQTYQPFVRLALARWQPDALPDHQLSRVVVADFVQLAADRLATVVPDAAKQTFTVTVAGTVPDDRNTVRAWIEVRVPGVVDPVLGWEAPAGNEVVELTRVPDGWQGDVSIPDAYAPDTYRLVLKEVESYPLYPRDPDPRQEWEWGERLVYLDVLPL